MSTAEAVVAVSRGKNRRWINHRIKAHQMNRRGQSLGVIADYLRVSVRSVERYLELPCPDPVVPERVSLEDFFMDGACGHFPELDWATRSLNERAECKAVCSHCPVLAKCRAYGLSEGLSDVGVWGGLTREERKREALRQAAEQDQGQSVGDAGGGQRGVA